MKRKGFTLIELLAVIVVLAIIALIATPIVINIIEGVKLSSVKRSSEMYVHSLDITLSQVRLDNNNPTTCEVVDGKLLCNEKEYTVETSGDTFLLTELVVSEEGYISAVIKKDNYCIMKRGEETEYTYKKIVDKVNNSEEEITENNCSLDPHTSEKCFAFDSATGTITDYYNYEDNASKGVACPRDVIIPKKIGGVEVNIIGNFGFFSAGLTSVVIPEGVTTISNQAFQRNQITRVSLPTTITSFNGNAFTNNKLPQESAYFYKRNSDGSIDYSTVIGYGGTNAEGGKDITIPSEKNGVKLTAIGNSAFAGAGLTSVVIPNTVKTIGYMSFYNNKLTTIDVPKGVTTIANQAFQGNALTSVSLPTTLTTLGSSAFWGSKLKQEDAYFYKRNSDGSIDYSTIIAYGGELKDITIPSEKNGVKLTAIGVNAFYRHQLTNVVIPDTIAKIEASAFDSNALTEIIIPESVTSIGNKAFYNNKNLTSVKIKNSKENVTLGTSAFGTFDLENIEWNYVEEATE